MQMAQYRRNRKEITKVSEKEKNNMEVLNISCKKMRMHGC